MTDKLYDWVADLSRAPTDRSLDRLEAQIARDIANRRQDARTVRALAPVRLGAVGLALALGVTAGAAATASIQTPRPMGVFAAATQLAPSTLLEGGR